MIIQDVKIHRSPNRVRTVNAYLEQGILHVQAPQNISEQELQNIISKFKKRITKRKLRKELNKNHNLKEIAEKLNKKYFAGRLEISSIAYTTNQDKKYGVCNVSNGSILISHRLAKMPEWVRDYIIVHEMAHLIEPNHSKRFHNIVSRYPLAERSKGFLMAMGFEEDTG
ncbi:MAG: M48 family metallopeptidase [Candidatus Omnitrophica bacterium]|nr:M48 family metallopeptidase [Candidatus Omnitrophota bacterium]